MEVNRGTFYNFQHIICSNFFKEILWINPTMLHEPENNPHLFYICVLFLFYLLWLKRGKNLISFALIHRGWKYSSQRHKNVLYNKQINMFCWRYLCVLALYSCLPFLQGVTMLAHVPLVIHYQLHISSAELLSRQSFLIPCHAIDCSWLYRRPPPCLNYITFFQSVSLFVKMVLNSVAALQHSSGIFQGDIICWFSENNLTSTIQVVNKYIN